MKTTLCIVGSYPETRKLMDFNRQDCDIWLFNEAHKEAWATRFDAVFQMHAPVIWKNPRNRNDPNHYLWLINKSDTCRVCNGKGCDRCVNGIYHPPANREEITVYMQDWNDDIPGCIKYPLDEIVREFGTNYFTSTTAYALALGLFMQYQTIEIYGVHLGTDTEYKYQRDGFTYWMGIARGMGRDVRYYGEIFNALRYGYDGDAVIEYETFVNRQAEIKPYLDEAKSKFDNAKGVISTAINQFLKANGNPAMIAKGAEQQARAAHEFGMLDGARQEAARYQGRADAMKEAANDYIFSRQEFEAAMGMLYKEQQIATMEMNKAANDCEHLLRACAETANKQKRLKRVNAFITAYEKYIQLATKTGIFSGAMNENKMYLTQLDMLIKAAGGSKSEAVILETAKAGEYV